jgi:spermidine synthase
MVWMGSLPMLLHPSPETGLVICFGTGQTANAVRQEGIQHLDIVDISQAVFDMAGHFPPNEDVLHAPGVVPITMDGRAWLRRTDRKYDVITLEPMPPTFAGVNALYCREFYQLMTERLQPGGIVAQWLPFHLVDQRGARAIAATFQSVFPDSILWAHPNCKTGILLGRFPGDKPSLDEPPLDKPPLGNPPLHKAWHRLEKETKGRTLRPQEITEAVWLDKAGLERYAQSGELITDDNQLLAYGCFIPRLVDPHKSAALSHQQVEQAARAQ